MALQYSVLTLALRPLPVGLVDVDIPGEPKVGDLADLALRQQHVTGGQVTVDQLQQVWNKIGHLLL